MGASGDGPARTLPRLDDHGERSCRPRAGEAGRVPCSRGASSGTGAGCAPERPCSSCRRRPTPRRARRSTARPSRGCGRKCPSTLRSRSGPGRPGRPSASSAGGFSPLSPASMPRSTPYLRRRRHLAPNVPSPFLDRRRTRAWALGSPPPQASLGGEWLAHGKCPLRLDLGVRRASSRHLASSGRALQVSFLSLDARGSDDGRDTRRRHRWRTQRGPGAAVTSARAAAGRLRAYAAAPTAEQPWAAPGEPHDIEVGKVAPAGGHRLPQPDRLAGLPGSPSSGGAGPTRPSTRTAEGGQAACTRAWAGAEGWRHLPRPKSET